MVDIVKKKLYCLEYFMAHGGGVIILNAEVATNCQNLPLNKYNCQNLPLNIPTTITIHINI